MVWWHFVIIIVVSYFIGNISFSRMFARLKHKDITKLGSGNAGSTNVLRNFGFVYGFLNLVLDIIKGFVPAIAFYFIFGENLIYLYTAGISVIIGHIYPVIYKFKGGKGIASMLGVFLAADPIVTLIVILCAAVVWVLFKYGSVASFVCVTALTVIEGVKAKSLESPSDWIISLMLFAIFCLTWYVHRGNIERLLCGKESKVNLLKSIQKQIDKKKKENSKITKEKSKKKKGKGKEGAISGSLAENDAKEASQSELSPKSETQG